MSEEFKFEDRYIVIKHSDVERFWRDDVRDQFMAALGRLNEHDVRIPQRQYLVIESDWPEFYPAFQMIEARVNGKPAELEVLRAQLDDYKSKWLANCEALKLLGIHARHAEKLVKICREKLEVESAGKGFIEALDGFIGALARDDNTHGESKAAPSGNYVQPVPEHCDRITWRGSYYHLPPAPVEEFPNCDYCGIIPDYHPWHGSGVINGTESPHIHACNECRHKLPAPISAYTAVDMTTAAAGGFRDGQAELHAVLNQAYMALIGYLPDHRNDLTDSAIAACSAILFPAEAKAACSRCGGWGHIETEDSAYDCPECGPSVVERAVEAGVMNPPSKPKTCIECDQPYCHGVCVERGDQDYDRDQAAKGGDDE